MKLQRIIVSNFRSFHEPQILLLHKMEPGLWLVTGENQVEPELGANGAGKSSLMEAVFWCLYGQTTRKLRAGNINAWNGKAGAKVSLVVQEGKELHTLTRTQSPNALTWNEENVDQEKVNTLFTTPEVMLNTWFFPQFAPAFIDLKPEQRMEIYTEVLALGLWDAKSDLAKAVSDAYKSETQEKDLEVIRWETELATITSTDYEQSSIRWEDEQSDKREVHKERIAAARKALLKAKLDAKQLAQRAMAYEKAKAIYDEGQTKIKEGIAQVGLAIDRRNRDRLACEKQLARLESEKQKITSGTCPTCGQALHGKEVLISNKRERERLLVERAKHEEKIEELSVASKRYAKTISLLVEPEGKDVYAQHVRAEAYVAECERALRAAEAPIKQEVNPYLALMKAQRVKALRASQQLKRAQRERKELEEFQARAAFWIKGFKEIRYQVIEESLRQLNTEVNECLQQMGLADWEITFSAEKETKSGTVKRGFLCSVTSPHTDTAVPWEAWSGGESQRLRLAAQFGISNLLSARSGFNPSVEFFDEPTKELSEEGVVQLLDQLSERAERYQRVILIADHRSHEYAFKGKVHVTKTHAGSTIETIY